MKTLAHGLAGWVLCTQIAWAGPAEDPFTGVHGGGQMGYLWLDRGAGAPGPDGIGAGGVHLGYARQWSGRIFGAEIEIDTRNRLIAGDTETVKGIARLKLRAGRVTRGVHAYGVAGVSGTDTTLGRGTGWVLGLGAEVGVGQGWRIGAELLHDSFGDLGRGIDLSLTSLNFRASYRF